MATKSTEHYVLNSGHHAAQDPFACGICGDLLEVGQRVIEIPAGSPGLKWVMTVHLTCAIDNNEVEV